MRVLLAEFLQLQIFDFTQQYFQIGMGFTIPVSGNFFTPALHFLPSSILELKYLGANITDNVIRLRQTVSADRFFHQLTMAPGHIDQANIVHLAEFSETPTGVGMLCLHAIGDDCTIHIGTE